jgi:phosphate transport system substrate-binding protein
MSVMSHTAAATLAATFAISSANAADITGAGATFPYPIYAKWADAYKKETGSGLNYQSIGSLYNAKAYSTASATSSLASATIPRRDPGSSSSSSR